MRYRSPMLVNAPRHYDNASSLVAGGAHFDRMGPDVVLAAPTKTANGSLVGQMIIAHCGVLVYTNADDPTIPKGSERRELVDGTTLDDEAWKASCKMMPMTYEHVPDVSTRNVNRVRIGTSGSDVQYKDPNNVADYKIDTELGLQLLKDGVRAVSVGYDCKWDVTPGVHPVYGRYDVIQRNRIANHIALTRSGGRANEARIRADSRTENVMKLSLILARLAALGFAVHSDKADTLDETAAGDLIGGALQRRFDSMDQSGELTRLRAENVRLDAALSTSTSALSKATGERDAATGASTKATETQRKYDSLASGESPEFLALYEKRRRYDSLATHLKIAEPQKVGTVALGKQIAAKALGDVYNKDGDNSYVSACVDTLYAQNRDAMAKGGLHLDSREVKRDDKGNPIDRHLDSKRDDTTPANKFNGIHDAQMKAMQPAAAK